MHKTDILGVRFHNVDRAQAIERVLGFMQEEGEPRAVFTPNPEMVMRACDDSNFRDTLNRGHMVVADGIGVVIASRILGGGIRQRVAGCDLIQDIMASASHCRVFVLGAKPGVAELATLRLVREYPNIEIAGFAHGYFSNDEEAGVVAQVRASTPDLLLVGLGFPRQEFFIDRHLNALGAKVAVGCGGSIDVFAGEVRRAPKWVCSMGLEWLYRLVRQPSRIGRMLSLPMFVVRVVASKI